MSHSMALSTRPPPTPQASTAASTTRKEESTKAVTNSSRTSPSTSCTQMRPRSLPFSKRLSFLSISVHGLDLVDPGAAEMVSLEDRDGGREGR